LLSRPMGLTGAINPYAASGGQDPEDVADARVNAPLTVLTLDRAVSLLDYENFARAFAGVAKALATWTWFGEERGVFITLAGVGGAEIASTSQTQVKLLAALQKAGVSTITLRAGSYRPATFKLEAQLKIAADRIQADVLKAAEAAVRDAFSFEHRSLGQAVTSSEVIEVLHSVPGVEGVFLKALHRADIDPLLEHRLPAEAPYAGEQNILPAELLTIDPAPFAEFGGLA
jgi:predicted phage baseplate assembly protein